MKAWSFTSSGLSLKLAMRTSKLEEMAALSWFRTHGFVLTVGFMASPKISFAGLQERYREEYFASLLKTLLGSGYLT
jgi:hypothetical protein